MITLAKHIETLLLDNDCVVVPDFGGFIAHYKPAYFEEKSSTFFPPQRIIGFNPKLTMNDGLLVQSYMQALDTDFSDANLKIENEVDDLKNQLFRDGYVTLLNIGRITCLADGSLNFVPSDKAIGTPSLYGLIDFQLSKVLSDKKEYKKVNQTISESSYLTSSKTYHHGVLNSFIGSALGFAVALFLFFFLSVPVENSYVENENYAYLGDAGLFSSIKAKSFVATVFDLPVTATAEAAPSIKVSNKLLTISASEKKGEVKSVTTDKQDKAVSVENVNKESNLTSNKITEKVESKESLERKYHVVVSSTASEQEAQNLVNKLHSKGYNDATIVNGRGYYKYRVSICNLDNESSAYNKLNQLIASNKTFVDAWVLCSK